MTNAALATSRTPESSARFYALWLPQTLAMTARGLTTFALEVWVYQQTRSATLFALLSVSALLPGIVLSPIVGWVVDRLGARRALFLADSASVAVTIALVLLFRQGIAEPKLLYALLGLGALVTSLQWPAYTALVTVLAPRDRLARSAGLMQLGYAGQQVIAPALAGWWLGSFSVHTLVEIDALLSVGAVASLVLLPAAKTPVAPLTSLGADLRDALRLIRRRGLFRLAAYIGATYFPGGFVLVLATPLVLTITGPETLGVVMSIMGSGMLLGNVVASRLAQTSGAIRRLLCYDALLALSMLSVGVATRPALVAVVGFLFSFGLGGLLAEEQAIWQVRVPLPAQGRVFALRRALTWASLPLGYSLAGPLADRVFKPALSEGGALAESLGPFFGVGPGRGIALLLMCGGLLKAAVVTWGVFDPKLRRLDASEREG